MYLVYRWLKDDDEYYTELIGVFPSEELAQHYCLFYGVAHQISCDDLTICFDQKRNLGDLIYEREENI